MNNACWKWPLVLTLAFWVLTKRTNTQGWKHFYGISLKRIETWPLAFEVDTPLHASRYV